MASAVGTQCPICFEDLDPRTIALNCDPRHIFHQQCILGWALTSARPSCPLCRVPISPSELRLDVTICEKLVAIAHLYSKPILGGIKFALMQYHFWILFHNLDVGQALFHIVLWVGLRLVLTIPDLPYSVDVPICLLITRAVGGNFVDISYYAIARIVEQHYFTNGCLYALERFQRRWQLTITENIYRKEYLQRLSLSGALFYVASGVSAWMLAAYYIPRAADLCFDIVIEQVTPLVDALLQR